MNAAASTKHAPALIKRPFVRLLLGLLAVILPVLVVQLAVSALASDRLIKSLFLALLTPPVAIWAYCPFVRLTEHRQVEELGARGALRELGVGTLMGALLLLIVVGILAAAGAFTVVGTGTLGALLIPLFIAFAGAPFEELLFRGCSSASPSRVWVRGLPW